MSQATVATAKLNNHAAILATNTAPTFSVGGTVTTNLSINSYDAGNSVTVQVDSKILLGGSSKGLFAIARYNSDGSLDTSFDGDGIVTTTGGNGTSLTLQTDGKILLGGSSNSDFALVRYNSDGSLDNSFDSDGKVTTNVGNDDFGYSVTLQTDGDILLGGTSTTHR